MIKDKIIVDLKKTLEKLGWPAEKVVLEHPPQAKHGDYAINIALVLAKEIGQNPMEIAQKIADKFRDFSSKSKTDYLEKIEVAKPGFINIWLKTDYLSKQIEKVLEEKDGFGKSNLLANKKIMVEFAHPNTHKLFHIGHLRNISLGESIVRLLESQGTKAIRANYQGDVGMHIAKCLYGILQIQNSKFKIQNLKTLDEKIDFLGKSYVAGSKAYDSDPKAKEKIEEINKKIYQEDPEITKLWQETRAWSLEYFEKIYKRVYTHYNRYYFESEVAEPGKKNVLKGLEKGIFEQSERAIIFPGQKFGLHNRVFITSEGNPTYEAKDMGLGPLQFAEYHPDLIIHVVGPEQKGYFEVVFKALEKLFPDTKGKEYHFIYGWVKLKKGKMSSRTGQVVLGEWLLDEVKKRLQESFKMTDEIAEVVAVGAVKYSMLKVSATQEMAFDIDESINLEGDSGPYLQYTYARCQSVLKKASQGTPPRCAEHSSDGGGIGEPHGIHLRGVMASPPKANQPATPEVEYVPEELAILRTLYKFPEVVEEAAKNYAPNLICSFLFDLAQKYNLFYNKHQIIKAESEGLRDFRLALTAAVGQVIKNGLNLLGIKVLEKM